MCSSERTSVDSGPMDLVSEKLDMSRQCELTAQKGNRLLVCIPSRVGSGVREGILPLFSTLVRLPQESCIQLWSPQHRTDMDLFKRGQRRDTEMIRGLEPLCCEERLRELGLFSLEKRTFRGDLGAASST